MCVQHTHYEVMEVSEIIERRIGRVAGGVLRWSLVLFFVGFGLYKPVFDLAGPNERS
jgi:hypothetical protein